MELAWLEDFVALAGAGSFSRAAERRNITQPAFSRRIRALEGWVGAALVARGGHRVVLTAAGERFLPVATDLVQRLRLGRSDALIAAQEEADSLRFACTHNLSLTYLPRWLRTLEAVAPLGVVLRLLTDTTAACERLMLQGQIQFLLEHRHPAKPTLLETPDFHSLLLAGDALMPVSAPAVSEPRAPMHCLPGNTDSPVPYLAHGEETGLGRIVAAGVAAATPVPQLKLAVTSHHVSILVAMARAGRGVVWAPMTLVEEDIAAGRLVPAGSSALTIPIEIRLFRPRAPLSAVAEEFWARLDDRGARNPAASA